MKKVYLTLSIVALMVATANADVIFDASTANTTIVGNNVNANGSYTLTGSSGNLVSTNSHGSLNNSGFASTSDINTLLGASLTTADTVTMSATITGMTADSFLNFEFGMNPDAAFRQTGNLAINIKSGSSVVLAGGAFVGAQTAGFTLDMSSVYDGFGITLTANNSGYTFTLTDVVLATGTSATMSGSFTGTQFVDNFGGGNFYLSAQKDADPYLVVNISEASLSVIPEPSTIGILGLGAIITFLIRRHTRN
jgi:hypothetical protein